MKVNIKAKYRIITKTFINSGGELKESFEIESDNNSLCAYLAIYSKMYNECVGYHYSKAYAIRLKAYEATKLTLLSDMQKRLSPDNPEINGFIFEHLADGDDDAPITKKDSSELSAMVLGEFLSNEERLHYGALLLLNGRFGFEKVESNNEGLFDSVKQLNQYKALIKRIAEKKGAVKMYAMIQGNHTTVKDAPEPTVLKTGRTTGAKIHNETNELLYAYWVKTGCLGSGAFEAKMRHSLPCDGLEIVKDENLAPFEQKSKATHYKAEFGNPQKFSGLATCLTGFKKKYKENQNKLSGN
jgi:hypothetical protein